jgi:replicative DNA helicase
LRDALQAYNVEQAREIIDRMKSACRISTPDDDVRNLREGSLGALAQYEQAHLLPGISGVPSGWYPMDYVTGGYQKGDLIAFIARMNMGKTYLLLQQALHAWHAGYSVLFVTMEMTIEQIARRAAAMDAGLNPDHIRKGMLDEYGRRRLRRYIQTMVGFERFHIYAGSFSKKVSDLEVLIHELSPDIIYLDSAYLMKPDQASRGSNRLERVALTHDELKRLTITTNRPLVTTSQFSRQAGKKGKEGSLESVAFSDAIGMHASLMFSVKEGPPQYERTRREITSMKGREGEETSFQINFTFSPVDFSVAAASITPEGEPIERQTAQEPVTPRNLDWQV